MSEPSAEERAKATALVHLWASSPEPVHLGHDAKWMAKDVADLLHAHAEAAVRAERERCAKMLDDEVKRHRDQQRELFV